MEPDKNVGKYTLVPITLDWLKYMYQRSIDENDLTELIAHLFTTFSNFNILGRAFPSTKPVNSFKETNLLDIDMAKSAYEFINKCDRSLNVAILTGTAAMFDKSKLQLEEDTVFLAKVLFLLLLNPQLMEPNNHPNILPRICDLLSKITEPTVTAFAKMLIHDKQIFLHIVNVFHQFITVRLLTGEDGIANPNKDEYVMRSTVCLGLLYRINERFETIPFQEFYNDAINEHIEIKEDFPRFRTRNGFSFCNYPFILTPATKSDILKVESMFQMRQELQDAFFRALFVGVNSPYLVLEIRREYIILDALTQLSVKSAQDLKKQLRVQFVGEEGVDEGGVQKEFFQLLVRDMLDPKYGMFCRQEGSNLFWLNPNPMDDAHTLEEHRLIGRIIGLAIYNSVILDLHFPIALYRKLMGVPVNIDDLQELDPALGMGLKRLLQFEEDVEAAYGWTFQIEYDVIGERFQHDLKPDGQNIPLTNSNRQEFVQLYVDFILNKSIEKQFQAFQEGFNHVCAGSAIAIFRPEEVELLVCGSLDLDFEALEKVTQYDGGYSETSWVIQNFWQVVHSFSVELKKRLLFFATGSDRIPIGGLAKMQFVIAKNGPDSDRLPTSHTCFNVLLLCEYSSKEKLSERLLTAISNAEGFGMI